MINKHIDIVETIDLATSIVTFRTDGIFQVEIKNVDREIIEEDIRELTIEIGKMGGGKTYPVLIIIKEWNTIHKSASQYAATEEAGIYTKANAIVVTSFAIRVSTNFFIKIFKPIRPTKMFNSEILAVEWLKSLC